MKQVWILNHYAKDPGGAGGTRHFHLAEHLQAYGWQASIIAASVDHASGLQRLAADETQRLETLQGVPFLWIQTPAYSGNGGARVRNMLAYTWAVLRRHTTAKLPRPDVVIGSSVHPFAAVAGALLARRYRVPFIFEVRDLWPQTLVDMGRLSEKSLLTWGLRKLERWLYRQAARTIVLLPRAWEYIVPLGVARERVVWIPNGVDLSLFDQIAPAGELGDDGFTLMYFGAHGQANGLDNVLQAMALVERMPDAPPVRLRLIGDGPLKSALQEQARALGLGWVRFEAPVPKSRIPALAAQADAFVFNLIDAPVFRYGISSNKLFDFMAGARPIIFSCDASNNPVEDAQAGLTVAPGHPRDLAEAIVRIASIPLAERQRMGCAGRAYVESHHSFVQLAQRLAQTLDDVCAG
ncbi:glycosyltransferase family 4 protein [Castellaniella sp.]|uniref:glycosyltransferase family 4 protein n=1 Tax=Castellaniella sp. TaxID=1955812 RepID=UPI003C7827D8